MKLYLSIIASLMSAGNQIAAPLEDLPVGLNNEGNTCFMNAALQCLYNAKPLTSELLELPSDQFYKPTSVAQKYINFVRQYHDIQEKNAKTTAHETLSPIDWCESMWQLPIFGKYDIGDAAEMLNITLSRLTGYDVIKTPINHYPFPFQNVPDFALSPLLNHVIKEYWENAEGSSYLRKLSLAPMLDYVPIEKEDLAPNGPTYVPITSLKEALAHSMNPEPGKKLYFHVLPKILIIPLQRKRIDMLTGSEVKITHAVQFPENLVLDDHLAPDSFELAAHYNLIGFTMSHGETHYTAYVNSIVMSGTSLEKQWYYANDRSITPVTNEKISKIIDDKLSKDLDQTPSVLFYQRLPLSSTKHVTKKFDYTLLDIVDTLKKITPRYQEFLDGTHTTTIDLLNSFDKHYIDWPYVTRQINDYFEEQEKISKKRVRQLAVMNSQLSGLALAWKNHH